MSETNPTMTLEVGFMEQVIATLPLLLLVIVLFFAIRLYIKLSRYLDRNTPKN